MWFDPGYGYHVDYTRGVPTGDDPESIYAVMSGTHYNGKCCFDYGNSENSVVARNHSQGAGTMEAIYFGNAHWQGNTGDGEGPWVGADLEAGMYYGGGDDKTRVNNQSKSLSHEFVSLYLRGGTNGMVLKGGDATRGNFQTMYNGARPSYNVTGHSYQPMNKKGAIILATGGDNSNGAMGKFYEGIMVLGETTDVTDEAVQANIVAVGYKNLPPPVTQMWGAIAPATTSRKATGRLRNAPSIVSWWPAVPASRTASISSRAGRKMRLVRSP